MPKDVYCIFDITENCQFTVENVPTRLGDVNAIKKVIKGQLEATDIRCEIQEVTDSFALEVGSGFEICDALIHAFIAGNSEHHIGSASLNTSFLRACFETQLWIDAMHNFSYQMRGP